MDFDILGPLRVRSGNIELEIGPPAQRTLLAVLLSDPNAPMSDDRLIDEMWGSRPPPSAPHLLQVYVSRLRRLLGTTSGDARISREAGGYELRTGPDEVDAERFLAAVEQADERHGRDPTGAEHVLAEAMHLWRGPPFADIAEPPPAVRDRVEFLERVHQEALRTWIDVRMQLGRHHELLPELADLVAHHPYDEALHGMLMLALYRCGRQAEALDIGRALRTRLRDDLGIEVADEVRDLYRDILLQAPRLALDPPVPPCNLPNRLTSFVGRALEIREVVELLAASRLVTLVGPAGIGKTRLAIEAAEQMRTRFADGVWWVDLARVTDPDTVVDEVARVLGVAPVQGSQMVDAIAASLRRRDVLLLIDNCEHVVCSAAEVVAGIVEGTSTARVLATSRTPLRIEGERLWRVPPLSVPAEHDTPGEWTGSDAVRLFEERGRAVDPSFLLTPANFPAVADVCRRLDGMSLAIEMAAARLDVLTPQEIADRLGDRFTLLASDRVGRLTRHRSIQAALDASYLHLSTAEQTVFDRLSVFAGPFDLEAAAAVAFPEGTSRDHVLAVITTLVDASVVTTERDATHTRYRLLETLREYGLTRLRSHGMEDDVRRVHADYHLGLVASAGSVVGHPDFAGWVERLGRNYDEVRQALGWSLEREERRVTLRTAPALREFWYRRADPREAGRWAARMLGGDVDAVPSDLVAEVHVAACFAAVMTGDIAAATTHADTAVNLVRPTGETRGLITALWARSQVALSRGDLDSTRRYATESLRTCDREHEPWWRARPLTTLGFVALFGGSPEEARTLFEEALPLARELGDLGGLVLMTLTPLADAALRQKDLRAAERYATEAVEIGRETGWEAAALVLYGQVLAESGDHDAAWAVTVRALHVALHAGLENWFRIAVRNLARMAVELNRCDDAALLAGASRRNMPAYGLDAAVYKPIEQRCLDALGPDLSDHLARRGEAMSHDQLVNLILATPHRRETVLGERRAFGPTSRG